MFRTTTTVPLPHPLFCSLTQSPLNPEVDPISIIVSESTSDAFKTDRLDTWITQNSGYLIHPNTNVPCDLAHLYTLRTSPGGRYTLIPTTLSKTFTPEEFQAYRDAGVTRFQNCTFTGNYANFVFENIHFGGSTFAASASLIDSRFNNCNIESATFECNLAATDFTDCRPHEPPRPCAMQAKSQSPIQRLLRTVK